MRTFGKIWYSLNTTTPIKQKKISIIKWKSLMFLYISFLNGINEVQTFQQMLILQGIYNIFAPLPWHINKTFTIFSKSP